MPPSLSGHVLHRLRWHPRARRVMKRSLQNCHRPRYPRRRLHLITRSSRQSCRKISRARCRATRPGGNFVSRATCSESRPDATRFTWCGQHLHAEHPPCPSCRQRGERLAPVSLVALQPLSSSPAPRRREDFQDLSLRESDPGKLSSHVGLRQPISWSVGRHRHEILHGR